MRQGLVLLSDADTDAPALPAICTVSKDDAWDDGGYQLGLTAAAGGALWTDRPYFTGHPDVEWLAAKAQRVIDAGGVCQLGNELNLPLEGWTAGPEAWFGFAAAVRDGVSDPGKCLAMPPSPGVPGWQDWVDPVGPYAVHAYGSSAQMQDVVRWYLEHRPGQDLYVTECNFGAGQQADVDLWAVTELGSFLDWCAGEERVKAVCYFAWQWTGAPPMPTPVDAKGTQVTDVLVEWVPPADVPPVNGGAGDIALSVEQVLVPADRSNYDPGPRSRTIGVVIHTTRGGSASGADELVATARWFQNPSADVSAHLVVGNPDQHVVRSVHDDAVAWHCRAANADHLGIEIAQGKASDPISDWTYRIAAEACRAWSQKYGFPLVRVMSETQPGLVGHEDTSMGKADGKSDPDGGGQWDWDVFMSYVAGEEPWSIDAVRDDIWEMASECEAHGHSWYGQALKAATTLSKGEA